MCEHGVRFIHFYLPPNKTADIPLNWVLSDDMARSIWKEDAFKKPRGAGPMFDNTRQLACLRAALDPDHASNGSQAECTPPPSIAQSGQRRAEANP